MSCRQSKHLSGEEKFESINEEKVFLLKQKYLDLVPFMESRLMMCTNDRKHGYITHIRILIFEFLSELNAYINCGANNAKMSHLYAMDRIKDTIRDCFYCLNLMGESNIDNNFMLDLSNRISELGRMIGGIVRKRNTEKNLSKVDNKEIIKPISFTNPIEKTELLPVGNKIVDINSRKHIIAGDNNFLQQL